MEEYTLGTIFADTEVAKIFTVVVLPTLSLRKLGAGVTLASNTVDEPEIPVTNQPATMVRPRP